MKIYFCSNGSDVHVLVFDDRFSKKWRKEVSHHHVNDSGHTVIKTVHITDPAINEAVEEYISRSLPQNGAPNILLQSVMELGFEAGREGHDRGLQLCDLIDVFRPSLEEPSEERHFTVLVHKGVREIDEEIPVHVLLHLYQKAFEVGVELRPRSK